MKSVILFFKKTVSVVVCLTLLLCFPIPAFAAGKRDVHPFADFSDSYKEGPYYRALMDELERQPLTGNYAEDMVRIAKTQVGYVGGTSSSWLRGDGKVPGENEGNYSEYARWFGLSGEAWCAMFVSWCAAVAEVPSSLIKNASASYPPDFGLSMLPFSSTTPQIGDLIFFERDNKKWNGYYGFDHTGLVVDVDSQYVYTVEGNRQKSVGTRKYNLSDGVQSNYPSMVAHWIGRPNYPTATDSQNLVTTRPSTQKMSESENRKIYSVYLDPMGGLILRNEVTSYAHGTCVMLPTAEDMFRDGYEFQGWYPSGLWGINVIFGWGKRVYEVGNNPPTGDVSLYAQWKKSESTTIEIASENGSLLAASYQEDSAHRSEDSHSNEYYKNNDPTTIPLLQNMRVDVGSDSTLRFCSYVSLDNIYEIGSIPNDTVVYVYGTTTEQYDGRTWAKINYNDTDGWVNVAWLAPYVEQPSTPPITPAPAVIYEKPILSISESNAPSELKVGSNFGLRGIIQTSCGTITNVYAYLYDSKDTVVLSREYTPNETSHNLRYSVNNDFAFGKLDAGTYRYVVEAKAVNGDQTTSARVIDASFRIFGASAPAPAPQTELQIQSVGSNMQVAVGAGSTLRFCSYVSLDNAYEIGSIPNDAIVYVYGTTTQQYENRTWAKINYNGTDGWVNVAWLVPYAEQSAPEPVAIANPVDISEYAGQWTAGRYYSDRDFYDDMLTIEQVSGNDIRIKWELYRIAGFTVVATVDPITGIAQFPINDSWSGNGYITLRNETVTLHIENSSYTYVHAGDEHVYMQKRAVPSQQQEAVVYDPPVLSISGNNAPSDMTVGSNFGIRGIIQTNCGTITRVQAFILDSNYSPVQASEYTPNEASLDLRYTVNNDLVFGKLPAGSYVYYVEATAVNGDETTNEALINVGFTVIAPDPEPQQQPPIQAVGYDMVVSVGEGSTLRFCSTVSVADEYEIGSIPNAQMVYVYGVTTQKYENRTWAKINYLGVDGWVNYDWLTNVPQAVVAPDPQPEAAPQAIIQQYDTPMLSISENNVPSDMTVGSNFGIRGIVKTSCGTITNVLAYILDSNYNAIQTSEYKPNESALDLRYSINNDLVFGRLPAGSYVYYVEATAVNGDKTTNETLINVSFNVIAPTPESQPEPSIQMVGYDMVVNVGNGSTLRFCSTVSRADEYEIGSIPNAQTVYVYGITSQQYEGCTWAKVNYLGVDGWVNYEWLATIPVETPQPIMQPTPEPTPIPQPDLPGYRLATKLDTNYVLDIAGQGVSNGDNLQLSRNNNSKSQGFDLTELGGGYWRITNSNSGLDLTAEASGVSGSNVYQWEYTGADTQQWYFTENADGSYLISNKASGCFLDVANAWANDGTNIGLFMRNDAYNAQSWYIQAAYLA